jgi:hypothetical protein
MAEAESVPTPIPKPVTDATLKASTKPYSADRVNLGATLGAHVDETAFLRREKRDEPKPGDLSGDSTKDLNRRGYKTVTGRMPVGWYIAAVCYATVVILLGQLPWNALLILLLFCNNKRLCSDAYNTMPSDRFGSSQ